MSHRFYIRFGNIRITKLWKGSIYREVLDFHLIKNLDGVWGSNLDKDCLFHLPPFPLPPVCIYVNRMDNENCQNNSNIKFDLIITSRVFPKLPERFEMVSSLEFRWVFRSAVAEIGGDRVSGSACWSAEAASECEGVCGAFAGSTPTCDSLKWRKIKRKFIHDYKILVTAF